MDRGARYRRVWYYLDSWTNQKKSSSKESLAEKGNVYVQNHFCHGVDKIDREGVKNTALVAVPQTWLRNTALSCIIQEFMIIAL